MYTPKQRMLNAYKGIYSDYYPVAPEFWFFYPAKVLGISMMEFQRYVPHWLGMLKTFKKYNADGWGVAGAAAFNPHIEIDSRLKNISEGIYRDIQTICCNGIKLERSYLYSDNNPCWSDTYAVKNERDLKTYLDALMAEDTIYDFSGSIEAYMNVGEDFLLEFDLGASFFDFFDGAMGFEAAAYYFVNVDQAILEEYLEKYTEYKRKLVREAVTNTQYEAFFIGCGSSCNSLLGAKLWRKWDKPYLKAIVQEIHSHGKLVHNHNHGKVMETVKDFVEIGFDCVCPFERFPGDVDGLEGLKTVRELLDGKVTFNGNVHTVSALANGTQEDVRKQVAEIKEAFRGTPRLVIGTGDQVAAETPEENIYAMIEEGRKK